jgi:hypothetical protein
MRSHKGVLRGIWANPAVMKQLRALHADGLSSSAIARVLTRDSGTYVTRNAVIGQLHRAGITDKSRSIHPPRTKWGKPRDDNVVVASLVHTPVIEPEAIGPVRDFPAAGTCRFIAADVRDGDWRCCGAASVRFDIPWCEAHFRRVYQPAPKRRERNEREMGAA